MGLYLAYFSYNIFIFAFILILPAYIDSINSTD